MKTFREIHAAIFAIKNDLKSLCDTLPITMSTLATWLTLLPVIALRAVLSRIAGMIEPGKS